MCMKFKRNSSMNEQIEIYINKLKNFSEVSIADTEWTAEFEQVFRT